VNGYISLAGAGERADKILERQLGTVSPSLAARAKVVLDSLLMGATVTKIDSDLYTYFHPSVQPYLSSWLKFDPEKEISTLKLPILILQGTTDKQVSVKDAALLAKAAPKAQLKYITGMNHVLKQAPEEMQANMATYNQPELPLSIGLMPPIYKFITTTK
jgi:alpha-beta hydrolase superfamily lysophospholipase